MGIVAGKRILVTGVLTDQSIAYSVAAVALAEGAEIVLTGAGRGLSLTQRMARKLAGDAGPEIEVLELDVTVEDHFTKVSEYLMAKWGGVDGVVHAVGFAPAECLGGEMWQASWPDVSLALQISSYSLKPLAQAMLPLWRAAGGGALVGLDFDATKAFPAYNWMGVAKAAYESLSRYLARDLGPDHVRCNLVAAGPLKTLAAKSIPGFAHFEDVWQEKAPLGWDVTDPMPAARAAVALLSDWFPATTGEIVHVDGGYHAVGA